MINSRISALLIMLAAAATTAFAHDEHPQQKTVKMQFDADKAVLLNEAGAMVVEKEGRLAVGFVFPKNGGSKEGADLDIAVGDEVGMSMGKKVSTVKELRAAYDSVKPGEEFRLGLRREGKAFIVAFKKLDEKDLPKTMVIKRGEGDDPNQDVLPALGVAIGQKDGKVEIIDTFPNAPKEMAKGDVIVSLNGKAMKGLKDFSAVYDHAEVGAELEFELSRGGKTLIVVTKRNKPQGQVIVK
jgi:S1-C subfamily serine protease